jgi:16S rRNA (adenine1518-N6/adenine1519-N6)-dimethyltransferase
VPNSPLANPSTTRAVLERHGLGLKKSLGQHFLIDDNIVGRIISLAALDASTPVLEVGPGIGTLTASLCAVSGSVTAVERDRDLLPALEELAAPCPSLRVVHADAVTVPLQDLDSPLGPPTAFVANLPYAVAATVVLRFFGELPSLRSATVMVQAEVADRMAASPGTKAYGSYTVKLRLLAQPAGRFAVPRTCFVPPPRVDSAVLRLERVTRPESPAVLLATARLADAAFAQRRKTLRNSLIAASGHSAVEIDAALQATGCDGRRRAETLTPDEFVALASALLQ